MYPLKIILVGCPENERSAVRQALAQLSLAVAAEFAAIANVVQQREEVSGADCLLMVRVGAAGDLGAVRRLVQTFPGKPILALMNADSDTAALQSTIRAGAMQVEFMPPQPPTLHEALATIALQTGHAAGGSRVIAISGVTEGAGATSLAINVAHEIAAAHGRRCALVELGPGMGRLATYLDQQPAITTHDLLAGGDLELAAVKRALVQVGALHILAGPYRSVSHLNPDAARVRRLLEQLRELAEVVVVDLPYQFGHPYFESLTGADHVVLVGTQTVPSLHDLRLVAETLAGGTVDAQRHVVVGQFDAADRELSRARLAELFPHELWTVAADPAAFKAAINRGTLLREEAPRSPAVRDVEALVRALLGVPKAARRAQGLIGWLADSFRPFH